MSSEISVLPSPFDPDRWEEAPLYREATLCLYVPERSLEAFRQTGRDIYFSLVEWGQGPEDPAVRLTLAAVARDLRWAEGALRSLGKMGERSAGKRLALSAARALARLAGKLEQTVV